MTPRVWVSVVTKGQIHAATAKWLLRVAPTVAAVDIHATRLPLEHARNEAVWRFLASDCTHFYTVDSDCIPLAGTIEKLLGYGLPVVSSPHACLIQGERGYMAVDRFEGGYRQHHPMRSLQRVDAVGGSGIMVTRAVLEEMGAPWFRFRFDDRGLLSGGEDFFFCERLAELGVAIYADFDIPQEHYVEERI